MSITSSNIERAAPGSLITAIAAVAAASVSLTALGQPIPNLINYQGRLTDQTGAPLAPGSYRIQFKLWDSPDPVSTNLIWAQEQSVSILSNGTFNVILGAPGGAAVQGVTPAVNDLIYAFASSSRFLGLTVTTSNGIPTPAPSEILPRQEILSAPYAVEAQRAAMLRQEFADLLAPPGTVIAWMGTNAAPPSGWDFCWGQPESRTDPKYARLFSVIGTSSGAGDGSITFNLPDLRGMFLRGVNASRIDLYADPDVMGRTNLVDGGSFANAVGSVQADAFQGHHHQIENGSGTSFYHGGVPMTTTGDGTYNGRGGDPIGDHAHGIPRTSAETRPGNVYVHYLIKL
jgi:hypothetical protein